MLGTSTAHESRQGSKVCSVSFAMPETVDCILCERGPIAKMPSLTRYALLSPELAVSRCRSCGLTFQSPRSTPAELGERYLSHPYYAEDNASRGEKRMVFYDRRIARLERWQTHRGRLLGIGCLEGGHALQVAKKRGWDVQAVESSPILAEHARSLGLAIEQNPAWDISKFQRNQFHAICSHSFEHLVNPRETLIECHRLLAPGGVLMLEVPNQFWSLKELLKRAVFAITADGAKRSLSLDTGELNAFHTYFFSTRTFTALLEATGFHVKSLTTYLPDHPVYLGSGWKRRFQELTHWLGGLGGRGPSMEAVASADK